MTKCLWNGNLQRRVAGGIAFFIGRYCISGHGRIRTVVAVALHENFFAIVARLNFLVQLGFAKIQLELL